MSHRWLTLLTIGAIAVFVFIFFYISLQPVWTPQRSNEQKQQLSNLLVTQPLVSFVNPRKGAVNPKITLVVYGDFQCQPCQEVATTLDELIKIMPDLQVVWKNMPNESTHQLAVLAAMAAQCAAEQGKFWEYHDALFNQQSTLIEASFSNIARELNLDSEKFDTCLNNQETLPLIKQDFEEATALQISATPALFLGEERLIGTIGLEDLTAWVKQKTSTGQ